MSIKDCLRCLVVCEGNPVLVGESVFALNVIDGYNSYSMTLIITTNSVPDLLTVAISSIRIFDETISITWTISDADGDIGLLNSVTFAGGSIEQGTECTGANLMTCVTNTERTLEGTYTVEAKVWDSHAQEWSNTATQDVTLTKIETVQDVAESESQIGDWVLPIGLGLLVILLGGYFIQSRKSSP